MGVVADLLGVPMGKAADSPDLHRGAVSCLRSCFVSSVVPGFTLPVTCLLDEAPDKVSVAHSKTPPDTEGLGWVLGHMPATGMRNKNEPPSLGLISSWIREPSWELSSS